MLFDGRNMSDIVEEVGEQAASKSMAHEKATIECIEQNAREKSSFEYIDLGPPAPSVSSLSVYSREP